MVKKSYKEIQKGDIFKCEYGDYENYVTVVFKSNEIKDKWLKTIGHYYNSDKEFIGYSPIYNGKVDMYYVYDESEL